MSKYPRITLKGTESDVQSDIDALKSYFENKYWVIIQEPKRKMISPAEYDVNGNVTKEAEYSAEFYSTVILPPEHNFDLTSLHTAK